MGASNFMIGDTPIKNPSSFKVERYKVTDLTRLASAKMVGDLIARKRKFYFGYEAISAPELNVILDALWHAGGIFYTLSYMENGLWQTATIYPGSIPSELHSAHSRTWVWKGVNFDLIEQ